jgi:hypothetical protein
MKQATATIGREITQECADEIKRTSPSHSHTRRKGCSREPVNRAPVITTAEVDRSRPQVQQDERTGKIYGIEDVMLVSRYDFTGAGLGRRSSLSTSSTEIPMYGKYPGGRPRFATHALSLFRRARYAGAFL